MSVETKLSSSPVLPRLETLVFVVGLIGLIVTGLPQKFAGELWSHYAFVLMGGIESTRILHRFFALLLIAAALYHIAAFLYRRFVLSAQRADVGGNALIAALRQMARNFGGGAADYRFALRLEYWVLLISAALMIVTGLVLWKPVAVTGVLPAETIPLFRSLHSDHALLLVVFLVLWRIGIVLLWRPGRIPAPTPTASADQIASRRRVFLPVALILIGVVVVALYSFLTSAQTAISTTIPREAVIYAPQAMPESGDPDVGAALWSTLRCAFCHGAEAQGGADGQPMLRGTDITLIDFYEQVRGGRGEMPAFSAEDLPDAYVLHLYTWLTQPSE